MTDNSRYIDNGNGTITDSTTNLMWKKTDSFQDTKKWKNWFTGHEYVQIVNLERFGGFEDWRYPYEEEAYSLFELEKTNQDKYGDDIYLDPIFETGSAGDYLDGRHQGFVGTHHSIRRRDESLAFSIRQLEYGGSTGPQSLATGQDPTPG